MQHSVAALCYERLAVQIHATDAFGRPIWVTAEQRIVVGRSQKPHDAEFLYELIPQFLGAGFIQRPSLQVALDVYVEEARDAPNRHCSAVCLLNCAKICQISPLNSFLRVCGWSGNVAIVL